MNIDNKYSKEAKDEFVEERNIMLLVWYTKQKFRSKRQRTGARTHCFVME